MQLAQKAEQRAETEAQERSAQALDAHQVAVLRTNAMSLDNIHKVAENAHIEAMYPGQEEAQRNVLIDQHRAQDSADRDLLGTLEAAGVHIDTTHGAGHDGLTQDHARDVATGKSTMLNNGQTGEKAGYGFVDNTELQNTPLPADAKVVADWKLDPKTGVISPIYKTLTAGSSTAFDVLITHDAASKKFQQLQTQYAQQSGAEKEEAEVAKDAAEARASNASALLNEATAKQMGAGGGTGAPPLPELQQAISQLPPQVQASLKSYSPDIQGLLIRGAGGWIDPATFPPRITKGGIGIPRAQAEAIMTAINPNWSDSLYSTIKKTNSDFIDGKQGQAIRSFNQFFVHSADLKAVSDSFQRSNSPWINAPLNKVRSEGAGDPNVVRMMTAVEAARNEWQLFIDSGYKPDEPQSQRAEVLMSDKSTPGMIMGVLGVMGDQAIGRLDQLNESYRTATGINYPNFVTPSGSDAANQLGLGGKLGKYSTGGSYNQGRTAPTQPQATNAAPQVGATPPPINLLKEGIHTSFTNGQTWTLRNGQPIQVK